MYCLIYVSVPHTNKIGDWYWDKIYPVSSAMMLTICSISSKNILHRVFHWNKIYYPYVSFRIYIS